MDDTFFSWFPGGYDMDLTAPQSLNTDLNYKMDMGLEITHTTQTGFSVHHIHKTGRQSYFPIVSPLALMW